MGERNKKLEELTKIVQNINGKLSKGIDATKRLSDRNNRNKKLYRIHTLQK